MASYRLQVGPVKDASRSVADSSICNTSATHLPHSYHIVPQSDRTHLWQIGRFFGGKTIREDVGLTKSSEEHTCKQLPYGKLMGKRGLSACSR